MGNCGYFNKYVHIPDWNEHSRQLNQSPLTVYPAWLAIFEAVNRKETVCQGQRDRSLRDLLTPSHPELYDMCVFTPPWQNQGSL